MNSSCMCCALGSIEEEASRGREKLAYESWRAGVDWCDLGSDSETFRGGNPSVNIKNVRGNMWYRFRFK